MVGPASALATVLSGSARSRSRWPRVSSRTAVMIGARAADRRSGCRQERRRHSGSVRRRSGAGPEVGGEGGAQRGEPVRAGLHLVAQLGDALEDRRAARLRAAAERAGQHVLHQRSASRSPAGSGCPQQSRRRSRGSPGTRSPARTRCTRRSRRPSCARRRGRRPPSSAGRPGRRQWRSWPPPRRHRCTPDSSGAPPACARSRTSSGALRRDRDRRARGRGSLGGVRPAHRGRLPVLSGVSASGRSGRGCRTCRRAPR